MRTWEKSHSLFSLLPLEAKADLERTLWSWRPRLIFADLQILSSLGHLGRFFFVFSRASRKTDDPGGGMDQSLRWVRLLNRIAGKAVE
jgi:hypothetical protein